MSNTTDPQLYSLTTSVCKPPQNFDFSETEQPFRFVGSKCFKEKTQKEKYYFIDEYTLFLNPLLFLKGPSENSKKLD